MSYPTSSYKDIFAISHKNYYCDTCGGKPEKTSAIAVKRYKIEEQLAITRELLGKLSKQKSRAWIT